MTTTHYYAEDQSTLDKGHKDLYRARAGALNLNPTSTDAERAVGLVLPELGGKMDGMAIRISKPNISCIDFTFEALRSTSIAEINESMRTASNRYLKVVLETTNEKLVSMDLNHSSHLGIFETDQTKIKNGTFCRILAWYGNEWGFPNRMLDTTIENRKYI